MRGPAPYPEGDGQKPEVYARYGRAFWDEQTEALRPTHNEWMQNLLFLVGRQWWRLTERGTFEPVKVPDWYEQPVTNLCLPFYKTFLAKAVRSKPAWFVVPASTGPTDMQSATLGDEVLHAKFVELKVARRWRRALAWAIVTGNSFVLPFWNTDTGKLKKLEVDVDCPVYDEEGVPTGETEVLVVPCDEEGEPHLDERGRPAKGAKPHVIDQGEADFRVLSPFQVRVNADADADEDVYSFVVGEPTTLREIARNPRWKDKAAQVVPDNVEEIEGAAQMLAGFVNGPGSAHTAPRDRRDRDLPKALVVYYYERQSEDYPDGRYWVSAGDVLLEEPGPLPDGFLPLIHMQDVIIPGRYHGMATFSAVVELNREYNEHNAKIREHDNLFIGGKWLIPAPSGIRKSDITTEPGECIKYNWPYKPEMARIEPLPPQVYQERERVVQDFQQVSGIRQVSQGGAPSGITAGIAIAALQEADDTDLGPFLSMGEESFAELAGYMLRMVRDNYTDERIYYAAGPTRGYMVRAFRGSDLEGAVDVVPQTGSSLALGVAARQQLLLEMAKALPELFKDPETGAFDTAKLARLLQIGGLESLYDSEDIDIQEACTEEETFSRLGEDSNEIPQVSPWQNHEVHWRQHRRTLAGGEWKQWGPEAQNAFLQHFAQTVAMRDMARMRMMGQAAGMMPGAGGEGGLPAGAEGPPMPPEAGVDPMAGEGMGPDEPMLDGLPMDDQSMAMA